MKNTNYNKMIVLANFVCKHYHTNIDLIKENNKSNPVVKIRQLIMSLAVEIFQKNGYYTFEEIANFFKNKFGKSKHYSTVIYAYNCCTNKFDKKLHNDFKELLFSFNIYLQGDAALIKPNIKNDLNNSISRINIIQKHFDVSKNFIKLEPETFYKRRNSVQLIKSNIINFLNN